MGVLSMGVLHSWPHFNDGAIGAFLSSCECKAHATAQQHTKRRATCDVQRDPPPVRVAIVPICSAQLQWENSHPHSTWANLEGALTSMTTGTVHDG